MGDEQHKRPWNSGRIFKTCKWGMVEGGTKSVLEKFRLCKVVGLRWNGTNPVDARKTGLGTLIPYAHQYLTAG